MPDPASRRIPWPRIFAEGVVIVVSILLALAADAWWQDRADRRAEQDLLVALGDELRENSSALVGRPGGSGGGPHLRVLRAVEDLISQLEGVPEGQELTVPDSLIADIARTPRYRPDMNTLEEAISSGQISLVRSSEVQRGLASWRGRLVEAQQEEQAGADLVYGQLLPHLATVTQLGPALSWLASDLDRIGMGGAGLRSEPGPQSGHRRLTRAGQPVVGALPPCACRDK